MRQCRGLLALGALGLLVGLAACGDDGNGNGGDVDAAPTGDGDGGIDATNTGPEDFRNGTIAITDMEVSNPGINASGARVSIIYRDLEQPDVTPIGDTEATGTCAVFVYNVGSDPDPFANRVDEGAITITGTRPSPIDLTCSFDTAANNYRCPVTSGMAIAGSSVIAGTNGTMSITFLNDPAPFVGLDVVGTFIEISGFQNALYNGRFPVQDQTGDSIISVTNPAAIGQPLEVVAAGMEPTFTIYAGEGPTPAEKDFLGLSADTIMVAKEAGGIVPAIEETTYEPAGANLNLVNGTPQPHEFPNVAQDLTFSCDQTDPAGGGNCGPATEGVYGFVVSGRTTDGDLTGLGATDMPAPVNQFATFQCRGAPLMPTITMAQQFVEAVLGTNPTRVELQLLRVSADRSKPATAIVVGHSMLGYTDITQP